MAIQAPEHNPQPQSQPPQGDRPVRRRRRRLDLPFGNEREDVGEWTYRHRIGLCVTLIAYLVLMIAFMSSKIVVGKRSHTQGMYIDLQELAALQDERDRLQEEIRRKMQQDQLDWRSIQNRTSNENATDERLKDDRGTNTAALNSAAQEAADRMRANREAYEQGLAEERAIQAERGNEGENAEKSDVKVKGRVTVSFSLTNPVRTSRYLHIPAYRCEAGGDVVVRITVDRGGEVIAARVESGGDDCMRETAISAARASRFNIDPSAPERQVGTITYIFIPQ
ncbi:MAG: TonB family protein [Alistipes sp.]|nr:TonB family protein [Alistipes sp.]